MKIDDKVKSTCDTTTYCYGRWNRYDCHCIRIYDSSMNHQSLFPWFEEYTISVEHAFMGNVIVDRWSKYSVSGWKVTGDKNSLKHRLSHYLSDKYFKKATHNTYAYRIRDNEWFIIEGKNDDGETGAGQCILTQLQRENMVDVVIVVTRYFWWVYLQADRFRHVIDATKTFLQEYKV